MNLAVPFSLSDTLERIIPGSVCLACMIFALFGGIGFDASGSSAILQFFLFLAISYALGVLMNTLAGLARIKGFRSYWTNNPSSREAAIRSAIEQHFQIDPDAASWRLCYGTCVKHGYAADVQLFLGLEVFCSSMMATCCVCAIVMAANFAISIFSNTEIRVLWLNFIFLCAFAIAVPIFRRGAIAYSRAFVGSIYEGFYSWYCEQRKEAKVD